MGIQFPIVVVFKKAVTSFSAQWWLEEWTLFFFKFKTLMLTIHDN